MRWRGLFVMMIYGFTVATCDRRNEIPNASDQSACNPQSIGAAEHLISRLDLPIDRVVTIEGMPHHAFFGWVENGKNRALSKLMGTQRRLLLVQEFEGNAPTTSTEITGLLRRFRDLPSNPWDQVRQGIKIRFNWEIPEDAYVVLEGKQPRGCR